VRHPLAFDWPVAALIAHDAVGVVADQLMVTKLELLAKPSNGAVKGVASMLAE
jgi:hypothetical protein